MIITAMFVFVNVSIAEFDKNANLREVRKVEEKPTQHDKVVFAKSDVARVSQQIKDAVANVGHDYRLVYRDNLGVHEHDITFDAQDMEAQQVYDELTKRLSAIQNQSGSFPVSS